MINKNEREMNYGLMGKFYMDWYNERDFFDKNEIKRDIKDMFTPYEFLHYSAKNAFMPLKAFMNIFSLADLLKTFDEMKRRDEDISRFTSQALLIESIEDVKILDEFAKREEFLGISELNIICVGSNIFTYGDIKSIGKKFPNIYANNLNLEQIEEIIENPQDCKGIPVVITIDNIGQLPLGKLNDIEELFDVEGVKIQSKDKLNKAHQGECAPLNLKTYKEIRTVVDDINSKVYVSQNTNKMKEDFQIAVQVINILAKKTKHDYEAETKPRNSPEVMNASGMVGLLTGKTLCKGDAEILRNVLSCFNVECLVIDGSDSKR